MPTTTRQRDFMRRNFKLNQAQRENQHLERGNNNVYDSQVLLIATRCRMY